MWTSAIGRQIENVTYREEMACTVPNPDREMVAMTPLRMANHATVDQTRTRAKNRMSWRRSTANSAYACAEPSSNNMIALNAAAVAKPWNRVVWANALPRYTKKYSTARPSRKEYGLMSP